MDWTIVTSVMGTLLTGTTVGSIYYAIKYRNENKRIKQAEATHADVDAQKAQIDLGNKYIQEMLKMIEQVKASNSRSEVNQEQILQRLARLGQRMDTIEARMENEEKFLNGEYRAWLKKQNKKPRRTRAKKTGDGETQPKA